MGFLPVVRCGTLLYIGYRPANWSNNWVNCGYKEGFESEMGVLKGGVHLYYLRENRFSMVVLWATLRL